MTQEGSEPIERWTAKRRVTLVARVLNGETSVAEEARQYGLTVADVEEWKKRLRYWIQQRPMVGDRRIWVQRRFRDRLLVNRKAVYRVLKQQGWFVHQRIVIPRQRLGQSGQPEQRAVGDGCPSYSLWP